MFRCKVRIIETHSTYTERIADGFYIEAVVKNDRDYAVVLVDKKIFTVPLGEVTWTGWVDE